MSTNPPEQPGPDGPDRPDPAPPQPEQGGQQPAPPPQAPQYQPPAQYAAPQPYPAPAYPPSPPMGGRIWLGIALAVAVPLAAFGIGMAIDSAANAQGNYSSMAFLVMTIIGLVGTFITAIALTIIPKTRRTGIGMWIGIAALPIIAFGVCTAVLVGAGM